MDKTFSATPLAAVLVEPKQGGCSDVWLRRNIEQDTADNGIDGAPTTFWQADEVHCILPGTPAPEEVEANFDALWQAAIDDDIDPAERLAGTEAAIEEIAQAVAELGVIVAGGE